MIDFENLDFSKIDLKQLAEEFKNLGKMLLSAEEALKKARAGESAFGDADYHYNCLLALD